MAMQTKAGPPPTTGVAGEGVPGLRAWSAVLGDPRFQDLPFKIETNARGQLVLSPHKHEHSFSQYRIGRLLEEHVGEHRGQIGMEFAAQTSDGVKVPDVVWISTERVSEIPADAEASPVMPEICIEVLSRSNTQAEMTDKRHLFFEAGAVEVWVVDADGHVTFHDANGEVEHSALAPSFPAEVKT